MIITENVEQRLLKRLQDGDKSAAREFYTLYADYLAGICSRDFRYRGAGSLQAWVSKVMVNQSLKFLRTKRRHEFVQLDEHMTDELEDDEPPVSDIPPDVIGQMLSRLPVGYRTVLNLYVFEDMSHQEIARLLGIKENSSASQLHRAKRLLAKMIKQYNEHIPPQS